MSLPQISPSCTTLRVPANADPVVFHFGPHMSALRSNVSFSALPDTIASRNKPYGPTFGVVDPKLALGIGILYVWPVE